MKSIENAYKEVIRKYVIKRIVRYSVISDLGTNSTKYSLVGTREFNKNVELGSGRQFQYVTKC